VATALTTIGLQSLPLDVMTFGVELNEVVERMPGDRS
jgi:hypothetical protein